MTLKVPFSMFFKSNVDRILGKQILYEFLEMRDRLNERANLVTSPTSGNLTELDSSGDLVDSGVSALNSSQQDFAYFMAWWQ